MLAALGLRTGVASLSPLAPQITPDISLSSVEWGMLAAAPALVFAATGLFTPALIRRFGVERVMAAVLLVSAVAHVGRGFSQGFLTLFLGTILLMVAVGVGNISLPVAVKVFAPNRVGVLTSAYATGLAISTAVGAWAALVVAGQFGWRVSLGSWGILSALALLPWFLLLVQAPRDTQTIRIGVAPEVPLVGRRILRSSTAWAVMLTFALPSVTAYTMFGLLPVIGVEHLAQTPTQAAFLLTVFTAIGVPLAVIVPRFAHLSRVTGILVITGGALLVVGYLGLALAIGVPPLVWVSALGIATLMFYLSLALIGLRSDSVATAAELSGFTNGVGYLVAGCGPLVVGWVVAVQGTWTYALLGLSVTGLFVIPAGVILLRGFSVDDDFARISSAARETP